MPQYGFYFDQGRCVSCQTCAAACKDWNDLPAGPQKWVRIYKWEEGSFPNVRTNTLFANCYHCENPVCVDAANKLLPGAMYKEEKYGAVLIDPDKATSPAMRAAWEACPYGAVQFESDAPNAKAAMCHMCIDRLEQALKPACVMSCPMRALDFGVLDDLKSKYGDVRDLPGLPSSAIAKPAILFKSKDAIKKKQLIPWDAAKALQLLAKRPDGVTLYESTSEVTEIPPDLIKRNKLVIKPKSSAELMDYTKDQDV